MIKVQAYTGSAALQFIEDLARLRIQIFRAYPYLYDGTIAEEEEYLKTFIESSQSFIVIAFDDDKVVGASTALPLLHEPEAIQQPWLATDTDISNVFYLSESVLQEEYRGKAIGIQFFKQREERAKQLGYTIATFCAVIRPNDHPLRPKAYVPLDRFWQKRGYAIKEGLTCSMNWKDINEAQESQKMLQFWYKELL